MPQRREAQLIELLAKRRTEAVTSAQTEGPPAIVKEEITPTTGPDEDSKDTGPY